MIGHYVRHIKSRKHPEKNIINRVMLETAVQMQKLSHEADVRQQGADDEDVDYPVAPSCTNSLVAAGAIRWPRLSRENHQQHKEILKYTDAVRSAYLTELLGACVCALNTDRSSAGPILLQMESSKVWIGAWAYATSVRENRNMNKITSQSWFAILAKDVHGHVDAAHRMHALDGSVGVAARTSGYLYGRLRRFNLLTIAGWVGSPFSIAQCWLFQPRSTCPHTGLSTINVSAGCEINARYVDMSKIVCPIALGPVVTGWHQTKAEQELITTPNEYVVMHCLK